MNVDLQKKGMPYVRLGNSGLEVSKIILGCASYGSPDHSLVDSANQPRLFVPPPATVPAPTPAPSATSAPPSLVFQAHPPMNASDWKDSTRKTVNLHQTLKPRTSTKNFPWQR
ncbi:hypothetical protein F5887DRAFT_1282979 [Amanita rubescens]|nr:hypothetical protein F5887DRAFT_1282979 [Amanita rubescens]